MSSERTIIDCHEVAEPLDVTGDPIEWLTSKAAEHGVDTLLAHADDGVVWGRLENGSFRTPFEYGVGAELRALTLIEARVFGKNAEIMIWREAPGKFAGRVIRSSRDGEAATWPRSFDEPNLLWGTEPRPLRDGFTRLMEGAMGHEHAPPIDVEKGDTPAMIVRTYVDYDDDGVAMAVGGRLVRLTTV